MVELFIMECMTVLWMVRVLLELPQARRKLRCIMVGFPGIMLEISDPCARELTFDSHGLPVAQREGHGLGVRSIGAFCQKHKAVCQFDLIEGWFRFRLVL